MERFRANENEKTGVDILISNEIDFKTKTIMKDKEGHYIMTKESIQQENIFINIDVQKYIKQVLMDLKGKIDSNIITVGEFKTPLTSMVRSTRQKINQDTFYLNTLDQMDLIDIYRTSYPKAA